MNTKVAPCSYPGCAYPYGECSEKCITPQITECGEQGMKLIIELAREHHVNSEYTEFGWQETNRYEFDLEELTRFATLVRAAALEEADKVIEAIADEYGDEEVSATWIAAAIRQLKIGDQT